MNINIIKAQNAISRCRAPEREIDFLSGKMGGRYMISQIGGSRNVDIIQALKALLEWVNEK